MYKWLHTVLCIFAVTPHAGVRIEMYSCDEVISRIKVTPHAGVRIEIILILTIVTFRAVTPHAGVRIEIENVYQDINQGSSPPTRGCELKYVSLVYYWFWDCHPPRGGAN